MLQHVLRYLVFKIHITLLGVFKAYSAQAGISFDPMIMKYTHNKHRDTLIPQYLYEFSWYCSTHYVILPNMIQMLTCTDKPGSVSTTQEVLTPRANMNVNCPWTVDTSQ